MSGKEAGRIARTLTRGRPLGGFPLPLNVGIDVCAVDRVGAILGGRFGARFLRRVLAEEELRRDGKEERLRALREKYAGAGAWPYGGGGHREGDGDGKREGEGAVARRGAAEEVQAFARHVAGRCVSIFLSVCLYFSCCCCCCYSCSLAAAAVVVIILVVMRECRRLGVGGVAENRGYLFISRKGTEKEFTKKKGILKKMSFTNLNVFFFARCYCCCFYSYSLSSLLGVSDEEELPGARGERNKRSANSLLFFFLKKKTDSQQKKPSSRRTRTENCSTPTSSSSRGRSWGPGASTRARSWRG